MRSADWAFWRVRSTTDGVDGADVRLAVTELSAVPERRKLDGKHDERSPT